MQIEELIEEDMTAARAVKTVEGLQFENRLNQQTMVHGASKTGWFSWLSSAFWMRCPAGAWTRRQ